MGDGENGSTATRVSGRVGTRSDDSTRPLTRLGSPKTENQFLAFLAFGCLGGEFGESGFFDAP